MQLANIPGAGNDAAKDAAGISVKASASFSPSDKDNTKSDVDDADSIATGADDRSVMDENEAHDMPNKEKCGRG